MLRAHKVGDLEDRVRILQKLVWYGEAAFNRSHPPIGGLRDPQMRQAGLAVTEACNARDDVCELQAIYWATKKNIRYTGDITYKDTFQSAFRTMQYGGGDCLPLSTQVVRDQERVSLTRVGVGDKILEDGRYTEVLSIWKTGPKPILRFELDQLVNPRNGHFGSTLRFGEPLRCSAEHRLFRVDGSEVRAGEVRVGDALLTPRTGDVDFQVIPYNGVQPLGARVLSILELPPEECADLTTTSGRFWLPESNVLVHNCDDHFTLNAVLAMENGFQTKARITSNYGTTWDHIYCIVGVPKLEPTRWIALDTTLPGEGKFGKEPPNAKYKDFPMDEP